MTSERFAGAAAGGLPESAGSHAPAKSTVPIERAIEAILMVVDEPLTAVALAAGLSAPVARVEAALETLRTDYDATRAFELRRIGGGVRLYVREEFDPIVADFIEQQQPARLSPAALETLAVIAYRQPISRSAVAAIRAVNVDSVVRTLVGRGLIAEVGVDEVTGATLYGTTDALLGHLGLDSLDELPAIAPLLDDGSSGFGPGEERMPKSGGA